MKKLLFLAAMSAVILCGASALALEYSADMVNTMEDGTFEGKMYISNDKIRMEMSDTISIVRMDKQLTWVIMPGQNMYMEQQIDPKTVTGASEHMPGELERTLLGDDTVDGRAAAKYRVVYTSANGTETVLQWIDKEYTIPVKTAAENGDWSTEYKNIKVGPQDEALFEVPAGCNKFSMPDIPNMQEMMNQQEAE